MILLTKETIDNHDIDKLIEWLKTYPRLTQGKLTLEYEKQWSQAIGCKYSVFVNSGSSANLLMLYSLIENGQLSKGDKVIIPAVSWSTDIAIVLGANNPELGAELFLTEMGMFFTFGTIG